MAKRANKVALSLVVEDYKHLISFLQQNVGYLSEQLNVVLLQHIYPLLNCISLPQPIWADEATEKVQCTVMLQLVVIFFFWLAEETRNHGRI